MAASRTDLLTLAAIAAGGYILYKFLQSFKAPIQAAAGAVAQPFANAYVGLTSPTIVPAGSIALPNGATVPVSAGALSMDSSGSYGVFNYRGANYYVTPGQDSSQPLTATAAAPNADYGGTDFGVTGSW